MKNKIAVFFVIVVLIFIMATIFSYSGDKIFTYAYESGDYDFAEIVQMWNLNNKASKIKIKEFVLTQMDNCYDDFKNEKITYEEALKKIKIASRFYEDVTRNARIENLQKSRIAFENGVKYEKSNKAYDAIIEYMNVIDDDKNFQTAKKRIEENKTLLKSDLITKLEKYSESNDYSNALKIISNFEKIFENDIEFEKYRDKFLTLEKLAQCDLTTAHGIEQYLNLKYSILKSTPIGDIKFNITVSKNSVRLVAYDYNIEVFFSSETQYDNLVYSTKYEKSDRVKTDQMLQKHMQALANDILGKVPNKKFDGYYRSDSEMYYLWCNYEGWPGDYDSTSPSRIRWLEYSSNFSD